jgi:hypothetical protein
MPNKSIVQLDQSNSHLRSIGASCCSAIEMAQSLWQKTGSRTKDCTLA